MIGLLKRQYGPEDFVWHKCETPWFETFIKDVSGHPLNPYSQIWRRRSADRKRWEYQQDRSGEEWWGMQR